MKLTWFDWLMAIAVYFIGIFGPKKRKRKKKTMRLEWSNDIFEVKRRRDRRKKNKINTNNHYVPSSNHWNVPYAMVVNLSDLEENVSIFVWRNIPNHQNHWMISIVWNDSRWWFSTASNLMMKIVITSDDHQLEWLDTKVLMEKNRLESKWSLTNDRDWIILNFRKWNISVQKTSSQTLVKNILLMGKKFENRLRNNKNQSINLHIFISKHRMNRFVIGKEEKEKKNSKKICLLSLLLLLIRFEIFHICSQLFTFDLIR